MRIRALTALLLAGAVSLAAGNEAVAGGDVGPRPAGSFDYYVLALTWVPGFCAGHHFATECSRGLGFALHGLWPQLEGGDYPTSCANRPLSPAERERFAGLYPSPSMIDHEWPKHGTCTGLPPSAYFALSLSDERRVTIPAVFRSQQMPWSEDGRSVRREFLAANPSLPVDGIKVTVAHRVVTGVEICLTKASDFRSCYRRKGR